MFLSFFSKPTDVPSSAIPIEKPPPTQPQQQQQSSDKPKTNQIDTATKIVESEKSTNTNVWYNKSTVNREETGK